MPPPSQLSIATSAVNRLLKEEVTYRKELENQEKRLKEMQDDKTEDENREFSLKQQETSIAETKAIFTPLRERIVSSTEKLENVLADSSGDVDPKEVEAAKEAVSKAKAAAAVIRQWRSVAGEW